MLHIRYCMLGVILALVLALCTGATAGLPSVHKYSITTSASGVDNPALWGNYVVWQATGTAGTDIFAALITSQGVSGTYTVYSGPGNQSNPTLGQNYIAWEDKQVDSKGNIYACLADWSNGTFGTAFAVASDSSRTELYPSMWGDTLIYNDSGSDKKVVSNTLGVASPAPAALLALTGITVGPASIGSNYITWHDARNGNYDVFAYNRNTGVIETVTTAVGNQYNPATYGNNIAWYDYTSTNGTYKLAYKNMLTGTITTIASDTNNIMSPSIYGDYIVWQDKRNGTDYDIWGYQISSGQQFLVAGGAGDQDKAQIYGNNIVYRDAGQVSYTYLATPEPSSILTLFVGAVGLVGFIRKRTR